MRRNSQGNLPAQQFTGQRLDSTGLYYYGARYYDPSIGRFISPDTIIPDPANPQAFNRYSYVINNPLKLIDPSGLDYVIIGGSGQTDDEYWTDYWTDWLTENGLLGEGEIVEFLEDIDPEFQSGNPLDTWSIYERKQQLTDRLAEGDLKDIKLIGFSEGAATLGMFLSDLADGLTSLDSSITKEIRSARLLECPTIEIIGFSTRKMDYLPSRLEKAGFNIQLTQVWNRASIVHMGSFIGWGGCSYSYDSRPWYEQFATAALGPLGGIYQLANTGKYHSEILSNKYALTVGS